MIEHLVWTITTFDKMREKSFLIEFYMAADLLKDRECNTALITLENVNREVPSNHP